MKTKTSKLALLQASEERAEQQNELTLLEIKSRQLKEKRQLNNNLLLALENQLNKFHQLRELLGRAAADTARQHSLTISMKLTQLMAVNELEEERSDSLISDKRKEIFRLESKCEFLEKQLHSAIKRERKELELRHEEGQGDCCA